MGKVIPIGGITRLDLDPDQILEAAKGTLDGVVILGWTKDEKCEFFASSWADGGDVIWLLEMCKKALLESVD